MTDYTKSTNFAVKDTLPTGDPGKVIKGTEFDAEFNNIQTSNNSKANKANSALTGVTTIASATITTADINGGTLDAAIIGATTPAAITGTTVTATTVVVTGLVDGRDVAADGTKLDGVESGATADQTGAQIKTAYQAEANAFTDTKNTKLAGIETAATADQTNSEIKVAYEANANTNAYTDASVTKLAGIEALADVTDVTNVTAAGALMDSELTNIAAVKALNQGVATTDSPTFNNITPTGTVDGRDVATDGTKLDGLTGRNLIINGNFDVWQRGTSFTSVASFTVDRFGIVFKNSSDTIDINRENFTLGQTDVLTNPTYFVNADVTAGGAGGSTRFGTKIEDLRKFEAKTLTISYYVKASSATTIVGRVGAQFGTGGSPSAATAQLVGIESVTTSWQKITRTVTVASIAGKTLGTNNNNYLEFYWELPVNTTISCQFASLQIEEGSVATDFEHVPIGQTLALCQRYYQKSYNTGVFAGANTGANVGIHDVIAPSSASMIGLVNFPTVMRVNPAITVYDTVGNANKVTTNLGTNQTPLAVDNISVKAFKVFQNTSSRLQFHWIVEAEL
tara:strand:+ start:2438 stop:4141 length:1704 start_codon:yes stop_codon:yes gene_type:complete